MNFFMLGIVGSKCGMTFVYDKERRTQVPVTVIKAPPCFVTQIKTLLNDGYQAIQVTSSLKSIKHINKSKQGHLGKAGVKSGFGLFEFRLKGELPPSIKLGTSIEVDLFSIGHKVDVIGQTKGKGFAGVVKRHHFRTQDASHGNSLSHRAPGSIGQNQTPGRVFKGKKMAGQMGCVRRTVQNLTVIDVNKEKHLLLIKGGIPGAPGSTVMVVPAKKYRSSS
jgi:large subunit ribosomal protein L3